jgi:tol-pal system protein YbgF
MQLSLRLLALLACGWSLQALAQVPVTDASAAYGGSVALPSGSASVSTVPVSAQGQVFMQLQQMQQEISQLRGLLEEQQNEIQRLKQEGLERYQDLDRRLAGAAPAPAAQQNPPAAGSGTPAVAPVAGQPAAPGDPAKEKLYYDAAFDLIKARDFPKASQAFTAFLRKYPNSQYAGNAQYWLGEVDLAQGNLPAAAQSFALVGQVYPQHAKVPDALYKLADVELRMGQTAKAKGILQQLVSQYPGSSAAQLAKGELSRLP